MCDPTHHCTTMTHCNKTNQNKVHSSGDCGHHRTIAETRGHTKHSQPQHDTAGANVPPAPRRTLTRLVGAQRQSWPVHSAQALVWRWTRPLGQASSELHPTARRCRCSCARRNSRSVGDGERWFLFPLSLCAIQCWVRTREKHARFLRVCRHVPFVADAYTVFMGCQCCSKRATHSL
jgi:hypothetical protein